MRFAVVPAVYVLFLRGDGSGTEVLLQLREGTGYMDGHWAAAAAGHVERDESVFDAAAREANEELDVSEVRLQPLGAMHRIQAGADPVEQRVDYFFSTTTWTGEPRIVEPHKCADLRWFRLGDLPEPVVPHEREVLDALRSGRVPAIMSFGY
ncbi:MAG TPA: NUDIX domain-containing protein [Nocardioidaceae bacterium]|jgi:8-oxo-dGTP pyrophosphatase MutT (NUDIX family)|nr:NUDIX domain-containing protein [Nocardioidaceae bacterium]